MVGDRKRPGFCESRFCESRFCESRGVLAGTLLILAVLGTAALAAPADVAVPTEKIVGPQLHAAVEIVIDHWGVPHIYAKNEADLFFAQGFNAARDRLFQIDLWRRRGLGQLAEVFGPAFIEQDKATRLFIFRGDM